MVEGISDDGLEARTDLAGSTPLLHRLWPHAIVLALLLVGLLPFLNNGYPAMVDESVYSYQAANLADGSWTSPRPLPDIDVDGWHGPLIDSTIVGDDWIPYARQPFYPLLMAPLFKLGGYSALIGLSIVGTWVAALAAAQIARRVDRRASILTLWVTGIGTPLLFDAYVAVGHSLAAALAGICALALLRSACLGPTGDEPCLPSGLRWAWTAAAAVSAFLLVLVRSEGALVVGGLALTGALLSMHLVDRRPAIHWKRAVAACAVGISGVAAYFANAKWAAHLTSGANGAGGSLNRITDPLAQAWNSLLRPWGIDTRNASTTMALALVCLVLAALLLRLLPRRPLIGCALLCFGAVAAVVRQFETVDQVSGLLATAPVLTFGLLLVGRSDLSRPAVQFLLGASAFTTLGILWLAYGEGGAAEWGGRFYHVLIPLLVPVAVIVLFRVQASAASVGYRRVVAAALVIMTAATSVLSLRLLVDNRHLSRSVVRETMALSAEMDDPFVAVATVNPTGLSRLFWAEVRDGYPILNGGNLASFSDLLTRADAAGRDEVLLITDTSPINVKYVVDKVLERLDAEHTWSIANAQALGGTGYLAVTLKKD